MGDFIAAKIPSCLISAFLRQQWGWSHPAHTTRLPAKFRKRFIQRVLRNKLEKLLVLFFWWKARVNKLLY